MTRDELLKRLAAANITVPPALRISRHSVAVFIGVSRTTLIKWHECGELVAYKHGGSQWYYDIDDLLEFLNRNS